MNAVNMKSTLDAAANHPVVPDGDSGITAVAIQPTVMRLTPSRI